MRRALPLFALASLAFAPAPFPKPIQGDLKQLQGSWVLVSAQNDPTEEWAKSFNEPPPVVTWAIAGENLVSSESPRLRCWITLDVRATPKRLFIWLSQPLPKFFGTERFSAIYRLERNLLTVCYDREGRNPPSAFPEPAAKRLVLRIFNRKSP
jgi:uncharacterized protein (TIGR03067 family)